MRTHRLQTEWDLDVVHTFFPLHPDTPVEGISLADLFRGRNVDIPAMTRRMKGLMEAEGLPYSDRTHTYNSRLAQELGKWGEAQGKPAIHDLLYRAYFVDGVNLSDIPALVQIAERAGLDPNEARSVLTERRFREAVDRDWEHARGIGVTGVPTFVAGRSGVVGAQPYDVLEQLVESAGAQRKARA